MVLGIGERRTLTFHFLNQNKSHIGQSQMFKQPKCFRRMSKYFMLEYKELSSMPYKEEFIKPYYITTAFCIENTMCLQMLQPTVMGNPQRGTKELAI
jgi:hypothetical protein